jgi:aryl-alcohol dehydrogenase-like predicted oxidoreductase
MSYELQKCNFIDTANVYTNGRSDSFLGEFMR